MERKLQHHNDIYFYRENLINSLEGRKIDLITITQKDPSCILQETAIPHLFPNLKNQPRCLKFPNKKIVFITARVHPGETPGSHIMNGILNFLCSSDRRAVALRQIFVFKLIPIINPDGVYRGYYRVDTNGKNLNRFYNSCSLSEQPTIYGIVSYLKEIGANLFSYFDLHAHAGRNGVFVYGNYFDNFIYQVLSCTLPKVITINCKNFDFEGSVFSEKQMYAKDKFDGMSKEGCGRVNALKITGSPFCYTVEANYHSGRAVNYIPQINYEDKFTNNKSELYLFGSPDYNPEVLGDCGRGIIVSLLDMLDCNPISRLYSSQYKNLLNVKLEIAEKFLGQMPYRFQTNLRKLSTNKDALSKYLQTGKCELNLPSLKTQDVEAKPRQNQAKRMVQRTCLPNLVKTQLQIPPPYFFSYQHQTLKGVYYNQQVCTQLQPQQKTFSKESNRQKQSNAALIYMIKYKPKEPDKRENTSLKNENYKFPSKNSQVINNFCN